MGEHSAIQWVTYRCTAAFAWEAEVVGRHDDGRIDIEVQVPGCREPVRLTKIILVDDMSELLPGRAKRCDKTKPFGELRPGKVLIHDGTE